MIEVVDLTKSFGTRSVLNNVNLEIAPGEIVGLIGASGSGKSTLLRCIQGLLPFETGRIAIDQARIEPRSNATDKSLVKIRQQVGMVFQGLNLWPYRTVLDNIIEGAVHVQKTPTHEATALAHELATAYGIEDQLLKYPYQLSGGQRQRVAIARAVIMKPRYLLLDEITSALDPVLAGGIVDLLLELKQRGPGILMVTHQIDFVRQKADKVCFLLNGAVWETGKASSTLSEPKTPELERFIFAVRQGW